jgi:hypothetical protein
VPLPLAADSAWGQFLWPYRTVAGAVKSFGGKTRAEEGQNWWEWYRWQAERYRTPYRITFAFVATHNHFVLDRGGKVFNRSAPIIKLPEGATEEDHLALLAYLNSSTACFYFRQVLHSKGAQGVNEGHKAEEWEQFLEFSGTQVATIPLPPDWRSLAPHGRDLQDLASKRAALEPTDDASPAADAALLNEMIARQERLDYEVYRLFGLVDHVPAFGATRPGERTFEIELARSGVHTAWFSRHGYAEPDTSQATAIPASVRIVEQPLYKRRWLLRDWPTYRAQVEQERALDACEGTASKLSRVTALRTIVGGADSRGESAEPIHRAVHDSAIPFLAAHRYTEAGLENYRAWQRTWELQRREDAGETMGDIPVPPKYDQKDFRDARFWSLRGKLDVPKERFISYPGCESDEDGEPLYGWAGWNHLQRAQALAELYQKRKQDEAWPKDRLTPLLAGLHELLPWLLQWHNEKDPAFGDLRLGDYFQAFLKTECTALGLTEEDLLAWRPVKAAKKPRRAGKPTALASEEGDGE